VGPLSSWSLQRAEAVSEPSHHRTHSLATPPVPSWLRHKRNSAWQHVLLAVCHI
jgi:hypothetical protein